jgi:hypothetical protein
VCAIPHSLSDDKRDRRHVPPREDGRFSPCARADRLRTGISHRWQSFTDRRVRSDLIEMVRIRTMSDQLSSVTEPASGRFVTDQFSANSWIALSVRLVQNVAALQEPVFADTMRGVLLLCQRVSHRQDVGFTGSGTEQVRSAICLFRGFSCCSSSAVSTKPF